MGRTIATRNVSPLGELRPPGVKLIWATFDFDSVPMVSKTQVLALVSGDAPTSYSLA
jgi:hypothetical protein